MVEAQKRESQDYQITDMGLYTNIMRQIAREVYDGNLRIPVFDSMFSLTDWNERLHEYGGRFAVLRHLIDEGAVSGQPPTLREIMSVASRYTWTDENSARNIKEKIGNTLKEMWRNKEHRRNFYTSRGTLGVRESIESLTGDIEERGTKFKIHAEFYRMWLEIYGKEFYEEDITKIFGSFENAAKERFDLYRKGKFLRGRLDSLRTCSPEIFPEIEK